MKVLVVEGEKRVVRLLERALKKIDHSIHIIGTIPAIFASAHWLEQHGIPDIILMSERAVKEHQIADLSSGRINATVIFTVQSDQFTFYAFRISHLEHLLPAAFMNRVQEEAYTTTLPLPEQAIGATTAVATTATATSTLQTAWRTRFLVRQGQKFASIETATIAYFFSEGRFIFFKTFDSQKYLVEYTLEELESMLDPQLFFRINRSLLIAFKSVEQIHPYFGNRLKLFLDPSMEKEILVSREKVNEFKRWLGQ
ncbi:MAG: LytTR family transcriptional regulator DNA-binding domain-containing protein [Niastella sp.]|nr:LytTR family transcriptional regulator DNA-binding domain-containing protein [Niastella sp.]